MEDLFKEIGGYIALSIEAIGFVVIAIGAFQAVIGLFNARKEGPPMPFKQYRQVWVKFGVWLLFGLEFELAADIIRSAITPTWNAIGQLAAIAAIRTVLNYFLERDIESIAAPEKVELASAGELETPANTHSAAASAR
jgi:uncharacterized membrane protein